jgi:nickel-dependent lactate racemase
VTGAPGCSPTSAEITWETIAPNAPEGPSADAAQRLRAAVLQSEALEDHLDAAGRSGRPVLLLVNDSHRATQTRPTLLAVAELLAGLRHKPRLRAVVATGTHEFSRRERAEFESATFADCGLHIAGVSWHACENAGMLVPLGGFRFHRWVAENSFLLPIGSVEPHYFAGLTGAHKTVTIGVVSRVDIENNHAGALHPASDCFALDGNPVHDGVVAMLRALAEAGKRIVAVNQLLCGDALLDVAIGDPLETLRGLLPAVRRVFSQEIAEAADILRLRVPVPLGRNLYQADKALKNNHLAVRDGGAIVLEADCGEGIGPAAFLNLLRRAPDYASARKLVAREGYRLGDHKAVKLRYLMDPHCRNVRVAIVSEHVAPAELDFTGIRVYSDARTAISTLAGEIAPRCRRGLIIEDAGNAVVRVAPGDR